MSWNKFQMIPYNFLNRNMDLFYILLEFQGHDVPPHSSVLRNYSVQDGL